MTRYFFAPSICFLLFVISSQMTSPFSDCSKTRNRTREVRCFRWRRHVAQPCKGETSTSYVDFTFDGAADAIAPRTTSLASSPTMAPSTAQATSLAATSRSLACLARTSSASPSSPWLSSSPSSEPDRPPLPPSPSLPGEMGTVVLFRVGAHDWCATRAKIRTRADYNKAPNVSCFGCSSPEDHRSWLERTTYIFHPCLVLFTGSHEGKWT